MDHLGFIVIEVGWIVSSTAERYGYPESRLTAVGGEEDKGEEGTEREGKKKGKTLTLELYLIS